MKRIAYIIPGFPHNVYHSNYQAIAQLFVQQSIEPVSISINWKETAFNDWLGQMRASYIHTNHDQVWVFGFSIGAIIALKIASEFQPHKLLLGSLSPYFREDLNSIPQAWHEALGKSRIRDFNQVSFYEIMQGIKCPVWLFIGQKEAQEYPQLAARVTAAHQSLQQSQLIEIPNGTHDIGDPDYVAAISRFI